MTPTDLTIILHERPAYLADVRHSRGLTQCQLAEALGLPRHTVARWERGERAPTGLYLRALAAWVSGRGAGE